MPRLAGIVTELLRMMIAGEHPLDLKLARTCAGKLECQGDPVQKAHLVEKIEMLDEAHLFNVPPRLMSDLRQDALNELAKAEPLSLNGHDGGNS